MTTSKNDIFSVSHWFDGFSQTHRFVLLPPEDGEYITCVTYNSRHTCDNLIEHVRKTGDLSSISFGQQEDPCSSFFKKVMSSFQAITAKNGSDASRVNVGVTLKPNMPVPGITSRKGEGSSYIDSLWAKTDSASLQKIDPISLEPSEVLQHPKLHPDLKGPFTGAHSRTDPVTGDWYNYNLELGRQAVYRVFCVSAKTGRTTMLATLSGGLIKAAYLHSIMLTERYVILCIYDAYYAKGGLKVLWTKNMLEAMEFDPNKNNIWLVIDRLHGQGLVAMFQSEPFFAFHPVNAWDQVSETDPANIDIVTEIPVYKNLNILKRFYYHNMKGTSPGARNYVGENREKALASLTRFKLPNVGKSTISTKSKPELVEKIFVASANDTPELPTFDPRLATKPSRYIYGISDRGHSTFLDGLLKLDTETRTAKSWLVHAQSPGEPIFVPNPEGTVEDDGVLLSVVLDGTHGKSYLLVLDARSFTEIGRAAMETVVSFGFHGTHVASS